MAQRPLSKIVQSLTSGEQTIEKIDVDTIEAVDISAETLKSKAADTTTVFEDSAGREMGQLCKVWVNFNGTGTVAIADSFNVLSITDNGTGDYTVNFTNSLPSDDYAMAGSAKRSSTNADFLLTLDASVTTHNASWIRVKTQAPANYSVEDGREVSVIIFGGQ